MRKLRNCRIYFCYGQLAFEALLVTFRGVDLSEWREGY